MKNSNIQWIGEIPDDWEVVRFKYLHNGLNTGESIDKQYWTSDTEKSFFYTAGIEPIHSTYSKFPKWKYTKANDILLARNGTPYVYFPYLNALYSDHIIRADIKVEFDKRFIRYSLQQSIASVVVDTVSIPTWSASLWNEQSIPLPPLATQTLIATYLDAKCSEIDGLIADINKQIETLNELKKSTITEAVTKGLNKNAKLKDSGIQWIGMIPEGWRVTKGKYYLQLIQRPTKRDDDVITCFRDGVVTLRKNRREDGFTISTKEFGYQGIEVGDLIVHGMDGFAGAIGISDSRGKASPVLNVLDTIGNKKYYMYLLRSMAYYGVFEALSTGIRVRTCDTNWGKLKDLQYLIPPLAEQHAIATYLDTKCSEFDSIISDKQNQISTLEAYKKSLIYEYVTGKKEVEL